MPDSRFKLLLTAIFLTCGILGLTSLHLREIWTDEGYRLMIMAGGRTWSQQLAAGDFAGPRDVLLAVGPELYQPLFYLIGNMLFQLLGGVSLPAVRVANLAYLMIALWGLLRLTRPWPPLARLFLLFFFGTSGCIVMHSMQVREYLLYLAVSVWSIVFYFDLFDAPPGSWKQTAVPWTGYVLTGILGYYTHFFFLFILLAQLLFMPLRKHSRKSFAVQVCAAIFLVALAAVPWELFLAAHFPGRLNSGWVAPTAPRQISAFLKSLQHGFRLLFIYFESRRVFRNSFPNIIPILDTWLILATIAVLAAQARIFRKPRSADPRVLFAALTVLVFFAFQAVWYFAKDDLVVFPRYFVGYYIGLTMLASFSFHLLYVSAPPTRAATIALRGFIALTIIASVLQIYVYRSFPYVDTGITVSCGWREISTNLSTRVRPGDTVIYYHPLQAWTLSEGFRTPVVETNSWAVANGTLPKTPTIWALDTHVEQAVWAKTYAALVAAGYRQTSKEKIGCLADLIRYEITPSGL